MWTLKHSTFAYCYVISQHVEKNLFIDCFRIQFRFIFLHFFFSFHLLCLSFQVCWECACANFLFEKKIQASSVPRTAYSQRKYDVVFLSCLFSNFFFRIEFFKIQSWPYCKIKWSKPFLLEKSWQHHLWSDLKMFVLKRWTKTTS